MKAKHLALGIGSIVFSGVVFVACQKRAYNKGLSSGAFSGSRMVDFNDDLPAGYDGWTAVDKVAELWNRNRNSPLHDPERPSGDDTTPITQPNIKKVFAFVRDSLDFATRPIESIASLSVFTRLRDVYPKSVKIVGVNWDVPHRRATHPVGTLGLIEFKIDQTNKKNNYTGMFKRGLGYDSVGLLRASVATNPMITDVMNRSVAIKFPVTGSYSRSLFAMHRVVGQNLSPDTTQDIKQAAFKNKWAEETDYRFFKADKNLTNILPPPAGFENSIVNKFMNVVAYIRTKTINKPQGMSEKAFIKDMESKADLMDIASRLSLDNMAWTEQNGRPEPDWIAPRRVTLVPNPELYTAIDGVTNDTTYNGGPIATPVDFRINMAKIPKGTVLWTVYADGQVSQKGTPSGEDLGRDGIVKPENKVGVIQLRAPFKHSEFANDGIMFKHFVADLQSNESLERDFREVGESRLEKDEPDSIAENGTLQSDFLLSAPTEQSTGVCEGAVVNATTPGVPVFKQKFFATLAKEFPGDYQIVRTDIAPYCFNMRNPAAGFPAELQGVWWMNGNPAAETLVTFANASWNSVDKNFIMKLGDPKNVGWYGSEAFTTSLLTGLVKPLKSTNEMAGIKNHQRNTKPTYLFRWNSEEDLYANTLRDQNPPFLSKLRSAIIPFDWNIIDPARALREFSIDATTGALAPITRIPMGGDRAVKVFEKPGQTRGSDVLIRRSTVANFLFKGDYLLTRIIDGEGKPIANNYNAYLRTMSAWKMGYTALYVGPKN